MHARLSALAWFVRAGFLGANRVVPISSPKGGLILVLQDSAALDRPSDELKSLLDLLAKSFVITAE